MSSQGGDTEIALLRAELQAARDQQQAFLRVISHDLRSPLRHILAYGQIVRELVSESNADPAALQYLGTMDQSARQLSQMIDGLIGLGRLNSSALDIQAMSLSPVVDDVIAGLKPAWQDRPVQWVLPQPQGLPMVLADLALLRRLLHEVIDNALKFTRRASLARIELAVSREGDDVVLRLIDNGVGFNPLHTNQLFGVFQRLHSSSDYEGLGLGLAAAKCIVDRLGGEIAIQAQPDQGCRVEIRLVAA
jgi:signal transduction histidine kinase